MTSALVVGMVDQDGVVDMGRGVVFDEGLGVGGVLNLVESHHGNFNVSTVDRAFFFTTDTPPNNTLVGCLVAARACFCLAVFDFRLPMMILL